MSEFQPTLLGLTFSIGGECEAMVTDETETSIYVESSFWTGWIEKVEFAELWGEAE